MKDVSEFVWPVENYTDKIHLGVKATLSLHSHLAFSIQQLLPYLEYGLTWLKNPNERQADLRNKLIQTGIKKLIQQGLVKEVKSNVSVEKQWQWAKAIADSGYTNITSEDEVATSDGILQKVKRRAIGARELWRLNNQPKLGILHK
jgi:hypothetical protein